MAFLLINVHWWRAVVNFRLNVTEKAPYTLSAVAFTINDKRIMKRLDSKNSSPHYLLYCSQFSVERSNLLNNIIVGK